MKKIFIVILGIIILVFSNELGIWFGNIDLFVFDDGYSDEMMMSFIICSSWSFKLLGSIMIILPIIKNKNKNKN